uniref:Uncharacterized protein n=1 Tax=Rhizophora mucronata TaxID=61149 RepID=A0A2P2PTR5_RHIMU
MAEKCYYQSMTSTTKLITKYIIGSTGRL